MKSAKNATGWIGVFITVIISGLWSYWGAFENFHEGWYSKSIWENIFMLLFQYLLFAWLFTVLALIGLRWKKAGLVVHLLSGAFCFWFFRGAVFSVVGLMVVIPFIVLGALYYFGEPIPKRLAYIIIIAVPLIIITAISIPQGVRISKRVNDNDLGIRVIKTLNYSLSWAPRGPGWPDRGVSWEEACRICVHLSADGKNVMIEPQNIWRLPTVEEAVGSMSLRYNNSEGRWNEEEGKAYYKYIPDKESPLWDVYSKVIYYWTSETVADDDRLAYIVVYNGGVYKRSKIQNQSYLSFRAVKATAD